MARPANRKQRKRPQPEFPWRCRHPLSMRCVHGVCLNCEMCQKCREIDEWLVLNEA